MILNWPARLPRQAPLTTAPSHNKSWSPLIFVWIFRASHGITHCALGSSLGDLNKTVSCQHLQSQVSFSAQDKAFVLTPRRCTRPSPDFHNRLCLSCQSNGRLYCFISDSMMKSEETVLHNCLNLPVSGYFSICGSETGAVS